MKRTFIQAWLKKGRRKKFILPDSRKGRTVPQLLPVKGAEKVREKGKGGQASVEGYSKDTKKSQAGRLVRKKRDQEKKGSEGESSDATQKKRRFISTSSLRREGKRPHRTIYFQKRK